MKNTTLFSFSPFPYFTASNLGKIYANFSGEIVTSSAVSDHRSAELSARKKMISIPFLVFHVVQAFSTAKGVVYSKITK